MNSIELVRQIESKGSFLCVGLDTDLTLIPKSFLKESDPVFAFNTAVIDATVRRLRATGLAVAGFATLRARAVFRAGRMGDPGLRERSGVDVAGMRAGLYAEPVA